MLCASKAWAIIFPSELFLVGAPPALRDARWTSAETNGSIFLLTQGLEEQLPAVSCPLPENSSDIKTLPGEQ